MTKKDFEDFDLEDIIREFGQQSENTPPAEDPAAESADPVSTDTVLLPDLADLQLPEEQNQPLTGDTVVLPDLTQLPELQPQDDALSGSTVALPDLTDYAVQDEPAEAIEELELPRELFEEQNTPPGRSRR